MWRLNGRKWKIHGLSRDGCRRKSKNGNVCPEMRFWEERSAKKGNLEWEMGENRRKRLKQVKNRYTLLDNFY